MRRKGKVGNYRSSVVITVFNTGKILSETIENVLSESKGRDEIVIVDDCSSDKETVEVIGRYSENPDIKVVRHEKNKGVAAARNTGVRAASAEIIVMLDGDDKLAPGYFEKMLEPFADPEISFTYCDVQCFGGSDDLWKSAPLDMVKVIESQLIGGCSPFRKSVHEAIGGYHEKPRNEDWDFWLNVCKHGYKGVYLPGGMYLYRRHENALSVAPRTFAVDVHERMFNRHKEFITKYVTHTEFMAWAYNQVGFGHIAKNEPLKAMRYAVKLAMITKWRMHALVLMLAAIRKMLGISKKR